MPDKQLILELVGYFASLLVLVSLLMTSVVKLRIINMIGSFIFAIYALFISSYPTAIMNFCLVGVNIFYLVRIARTEKYLALLPVRPGSAYLEHFLQFHRQDILKYFPDLDAQAPQADTAFFVCCDTVPAGLMMGRDLGNGTLEVFLDYTTSQYRDCSIGRYLYRQLPGQGLAALVISSPSQAHEAYLKKMGFYPEEGGYRKELAPQ